MSNQIFSGPLDQHPLFAAQHAAAKAVARTTAPVGAPLRGGPAKAAPAPQRNAAGNPFAAKLPSMALAPAKTAAFPRLPNAPTPQQRQTTAKIAQANKEGMGRVEAQLHHQSEAFNRRESLPLNFKLAPNQRAHPVNASEKRASALIEAKIEPHPESFARLGQMLPSPQKTIENIPSSVANTITGIPAGIIGTGNAVVSAAKGNPKELEAIGKGLGEIAMHPSKSIEDNPAGTALMFAGAGSGVGTAAGAVARTGALGEKVAQAAEIARPALKLYGDLEVPRKYSPDLIRKGGQVAADKFREKVLNENPNQATGTRLNRRIYGGGMLGQFMERNHVPAVQGFAKPGHVDFAEGAVKAVRKEYTTAASGFMGHIKPGPKGAEQAVPLAAEGTLRGPATVEADLTKRLAGLKDAAGSLTGNEARLNKAQQAQVSGLLANKQFMAHPEPAFEAAKNFADHQQPLIEKKVQLGALEPDQVHAKMVPYATQHMGAEYNIDPGAHPLVKQVKGLERAEGIAQKSKDSNWLANTRGKLLSSKQDLAGMKASGLIKNSGDMYPRLELNGKPLTHEQIMAHARQNIGDRELGFLTHKETSFGQSTHSKTAVRPPIEKRSRTGEAYKAGAYDSSWKGLETQAYKDANEVAGHEGRDEMVRRFGLGSYHSQEEAQKAADNFNHTPEGAQLTKSLGPMGVAHAGPDRVLNRANMPSAYAGKIASDFGVAEHKAVTELGAEGKFRLMPQSVIDRIAEHDKLNDSTKTTRALQNYTNKWRSTALFTTPRWPVGVGQENAIRLAAANVNPFALFGFGHSVKLGGDMATHFRAIMDDPSASEAQRFAAHAQVANMDAGTQYGSYIYNSVRRTADQVPPEAKVGMEAFTGHAPVSQMLDGWEHWKAFVGSGMHKIETNTKKAMLGKVALKESGRFTQQWKDLLTRQDAAVKDYAKGALTPSRSAKLGQDIMDMAGNWTHLTPSVRRATQTYSPFGLWWLNSMKFIFQTLPKDHPFKTAALAAMEAGTGSTKPQAETPSYLAGGVGLDLPIVGHVTMTPLHYTPFGVAVDATKTAAGMVMPQFADPGLTSLGIKPLSYEPEAPSHTKIPEATSLLKGLEEVPTGLIPGLRAAVTILRKGGKPVPGSLNPIATKPGTQTGLAPALAKYLAPFPFTANKNAAQGGRERPGRERPERERPSRERPTRERPSRER